MSSMLISIGKRAAPPDLAGLLLECHARIRHFAALAVRLASSEAGAPDRVEAAAAIARYFDEALPLHVRDEEESLVPRLRGRSAVVDAALDRMLLEHAAHDALRLELIGITRAIASDVGTFATHAGQLRALAAQVQEDLVSHVQQEESAIFPMIGTLLSAEEQSAVVAEMRARRA